MNNELPILYPCHLHSWFSLADSCVSPQKLVKRMQELGLNKTAITDHGNVVHVIRFGSKLKENNLTLYPGEEFYYCDDVTQKDKDHRAAYHLTIVAYTQEGLSTLYSLSSLSYAEGFYFKPKIDIKMLREHNKGIRVSSACIKGQIAENIINDDYESAKAVAKAFKEIFGGNFYLEIMPHDLDEQRKANLGILKISQELDIPLLATYDAHMCWKNETKYRRFLMQMTKAGWADGDEELGMTDTIYMMSAQEYLDYFAQYHPDFPQDKVIEAIANTEKYLGNEVVELEDDTCIFPKIDIPAPYKDDLDYIRHLLWNSMKEKGLDKNQKYIDRVKMELEIMNNDGFVPYFLVLYDVFNWCRKNHVMTGAGRGCFTEDALVLTNNGLKYIKDVTTGDKVITADGKFEQVLETHKYPINEETIQFNYLYNGNAINRCTKDHKILVNRNGVVDYIKAEELHLGDLLCSPKIKVEEDTKQYVDFDFDGTNIASDDNYWYLPVTEIIKHQKEELFVYDLTIANNPSYTLNNIIVHNSGAASLMNYLLGITRIDPLKFDLRFDRFYNSGRKGADGAPDVDSDFADARREEVIKYTEEKYGADKISQICNISTMKLKSCIKDCARVLKVPFAEANAITNKIDWDAFESLDEAKEDKVAGAIIRKYSEVFEYVEYFLGFPRQFGKHAAGIIIANRRIGDICPMMLSEVEGKKFLISQFDKDDVHKTGLIKFDYLGLSTLTFLTHILDDIKRTTGKDIDLDSLDVEDKAVYKNILATADTDNVFQMESGGMKAYLKRLSPDRFGDLSALNSLYRPAGIKSGAIDNYINNKYNKPKTYGVKELDDLLAKTNFVICYDEIKMDIVGTFGEFPPKDINKFRKSSGKKDPKSMQYCQDMKPMFVENAQKHGLTAEQASSLYDSLIGYAFCKAHADCYSLLTFWTAWLKYYYPVNFLHASFTFSTTDVEKDKYSIKTAIKMAKKMGYRFVSVDVNKSKANFSFDDENKIIYWSMRNIKQVSEDIAKKIEENQPYVDFNDFVTRGKEFGVSKRVIDPLVVLGAFDSLNCPEQIKEWYIKNNKLKKADRESLGIETKEAELEHIENKFNVEIVKRSMQDKENEYLGLVISMDSVDFQVVKRCINNDKFRKLKDRDSCSLYGILTKKELKKSKSGGNYGVLTIMDPDYNFYTIQVGSKAYAQLEQSGIPSEYKLEEGRWVMLNGSKCDETRLFLNGTQIVDLKEYERKVLNGIIKEKMVFQA